MPQNVRIGTASWSDPEFVRDWYPPRLPPDERLQFYAQRFSFVELNSSFYGIPNRLLVARWCRQTPPGFLFDVKLHRLLSRHVTKPDSLAPDLRPLARVEHGSVRLSAELEQAVARRILQETEPFRQAGKLGAYLLQLAPSFGPDRHELEELDPLLGIFGDHRVAIELRNRHWMSAARAPETLGFFRSRQITLVLLDGPEESPADSVMPACDEITSPRLAYLRLHGRNERAFVSGRTVAERFDYLYSEQELAGILSRVDRLRSRAREVHVVFNNNRSDYAPVAAARLQQLLQGIPSRPAA